MQITLLKIQIYILMLIAMYFDVVENIGGKFQHLCNLKKVYI